jgi:hypothetical protein
MKLLKTIMIYFLDWVLTRIKEGLIYCSKYEI